MNEKEFIKDWQKKVRENKIHNLFLVEDYDLWTFFEPLILGNSSFHHFMGFPQLFKVVTRKEFNKKKILKKIIFRPFIFEKYFKLRAGLRPLFTKRKNDKHQDLIFLSSERFDKNKIEDHQIFGELFKLLKKKKKGFKLIKFDLFNNFPKRLPEDPNSTFIGQYYNKEVKTETKKLTRKIKKRLKDIQYDRNFINLFKINNKDFLPAFKEQVAFFFRVMPFYIADLLCLTKEILKVEKPKCAVLVSEADFYSKGIIQNAKETKTIALQFGPITERLCDINPTNKVLPSIKCVSGLSDKKILNNFYKYPRNRIKVTGEPRYDYIKEKIDKNRIYADLGLDKNTKTIVFFDEGPGILKSAEKITSILKEFSKKNNVVIKLHPSEKNSTYPIYKKVSEGKIKITRYDTRKLIKVSDVTLTCFSTVAIEAIIAGKPLVLINLGHIYPDYFDFDKEGSALRAYSEEALRGYINKCLYDRKILKKLVNGRKLTFKKHYYEYPGKSSEAVHQEIRRFIE